MIKSVHLFLVTLSIAGFVVRFIGHSYQARWSKSRLIKVLPHVLDTMLLVSGVWLIVESGFYPWQQGWLFLKLVLLVAYVILGALCFRAVHKGRRYLLLAAALGVVGAMVYLVLWKPF